MACYHFSGSTAPFCDTGHFQSSTKAQSWYRVGVGMGMEVGFQGIKDQSGNMGCGVGALPGSAGCAGPEPCGRDALEAKTCMTMTAGNVVSRL